MAAPIAGRLVLQAKGPYKDSRGRFTSRANYLREQRRLASGKLGTYQQAFAERSKEAFLRSKWGAPPAGKSWMQIAGKYPERFVDYLEELQ